MELLHVCVQMGIKHKGSSAVLANQLWRPMSTAEVVPKLLFASEFLATPLLPTTEPPFFAVHSPDVFVQAGSVGKCRGALNIAAHQLLHPMSCRALVSLQVKLAPKRLTAVTSRALECLLVLSMVNLGHVEFERGL